MTRLIIKLSLDLKAIMLIAMTSPAIQEPYAGSNGAEVAS